MILRLATTGDAERLCAIYAPYVETTAISFETEVPTAAEMAGRVEETLPRHPWLVAEDDGELLGYAYAHPFSDRAAYRWSVTVSVYVASAAHRRGIGRTLYEALFRALTLQGYRQAFAGITLPNEASVGLHQSLGFTRVATYRHVGWKFGVWHDVGWWQRPLGDGASVRPAEPRSLADLPSAFQ